MNRRQLSPSNVIALNTVSNSTNAGLYVTDSAAAGNVVHGNRIGVAETCTDDASNGPQAIIVSSGAHDNTIGTPGSTLLFSINFIHSDATGVWISPSAGTGNTVIANYITALAGLAIDLGTLGPTDNDMLSLDNDTGPNGMQNFPVNVHVYRTQTAEWIEGDIDTSYSPTPFRLDFYYAAGDMGPQGRGVPETYFGQSGVDSPLTNMSGLAHF